MLPGMLKIQHKLLRNVGSCVERLVAVPRAERAAYSSAPFPLQDRHPRRGRRAAGGYRPGDSALLWQRAARPLDLALLAEMYALVAFEVTVGYHRMLTHRSLRPHPAIKAALLILGSMAVEGPALDWAATHIKHHARADREGD
jgi:hypothetical protein